MPILFLKRVSVSLSCNLMQPIILNILICVLLSFLPLPKDGAQFPPPYIVQILAS